MTEPLPIFALMAEFRSPNELLDATRSARRAGYQQMDAYTPYAIEGLATELGMKRSPIPSVVLIAGLVGAAVGYGMQYFSMAIDYPYNAGGRPLNSWPVFVPIMFEMAILIAALSAFLAVMFLNDLPRLHHPVFDEPRFTRASQDSFFLCIEAKDPKFDIEQTARFLIGLGAYGDVMAVPLAQPQPCMPSDSETELESDLERDQRQKVTSV